jgi:hypothetical protein
MVAISWFWFTSLRHSDHSDHPPMAGGRVVGTKGASVTIGVHVGHTGHSDIFSFLFLYFFLFAFGFSFFLFHAQRKKKTKEKNECLRFSKSSRNKRRPRRAPHAPCALPLRLAH